MDWKFINGLKWQLDCIQSLIQNKGVYRYYLSPSPTITYRHHPSLLPITITYRHHLSLLPITITHRHHPSLLPITITYHHHHRHHHHLSLLPTNPRYWLTGDGDG